VYTLNIYCPEQKRAFILHRYLIIDPSLPFSLWWNPSKLTFVRTNLLYLQKTHISMEYTITTLCTQRWGWEMAFHRLYHRHNPIYIIYMVWWDRKLETRIGRCLCLFPHLENDEVYFSFVFYYFMNSCSLMHWLIILLVRLVYLQIPLKMGSEKLCYMIFPKVSLNRNQWLACSSLLPC